MSDPKKHHYLPQFYLRNFAISPQNGKYPHIWACRCVLRVQRMVSIDQRLIEGPITLVIGGRAMALTTSHPWTSAGERKMYEIVMAEVPLEVVEELFTSDDICIQYFLGEPIRLTEAEVANVRALSP